jgi:AraC-like DNA-binding protein
MEHIRIDPSDERRILDFRPLGFRDVVLLGRYNYAAVRQRLEEHCHGNMVEICYLERGQQTYFVGQQRFDLNGGDVFITYPGETHGTGKAPEGKGVLYWLLMRVPGPKERFLSLSPTMGRQLMESLLNMPSRCFKGGEPVARTLHRICGVYDQPANPLRPVELQNLLLRFLLDVLEASHRAPTSISPVIARVQAFVEHNHDSVMTVRQLARLAHLSEPRFKSRFKQEVGIPPGEYILRQKIEHAKAHLASNVPSITETAMRFGFSTSHYFATVFKRYNGETPSQYRQRCRTT